MSGIPIGAIVFNGTSDEAQSYSEKVKALIEGGNGKPVVLTRQMIEFSRAIAILRRIVDNKDPFYDPNDYSNEICFFCSEGEPNHEIDCPYIQAQQLLSEIDNG